MKILKIKKMSQNKYKMILENTEIITFDNVILEYNLLYKKELTEKEIKEIHSKTNYYDTYNKTLKYIEKKIRSKKEIEKYLEKFVLTDNEKNKIIEKLEQLNLINDELYCKSFINDKIHLSKYGINKIRKLLISQNIDIDIINAELKRVDTEEVDYNLETKIKRKIQNNHKYSNYELKNRLINYFVNEGYDKSKIICYIDKYLEEDSLILEKEFNKLYKKYKIKYDSNTLLLKIKQKLIQKGFSVDLINNIIQEKTEE